VWEHKLNEMEQLRDGIGKGLDQHIKETVAVLQLFGVHTQHSCEGHLDHGVAAPWIDIQSPDLRLEEFFRNYGVICPFIMSPVDMLGLSHIDWRYDET
jgi:hypothetical protein